MAPLEQAADRANVSYRQANYWARQGWLRVTWFDAAGERIDGDFEGGSGYRAWLSARETQRLRLMGRLVNAGFSPATAYEISVRLPTGEGNAPLGPGITILVADVVQANA